MKRISAILAVILFGAFVTLCFGNLANGEERDVATDRPLVIFTQAELALAKLTGMTEDTKRSYLPRIGNGYCRAFGFDQIKESKLTYSRQILGYFFWMLGISREGAETFEVAEVVTHQEAWAHSGVELESIMLPYPESQFQFLTYDGQPVGVQSRSLITGTDPDFQTRTYVLDSLVGTLVFSRLVCVRSG